MIVRTLVFLAQTFFFFCIVILETKFSIIGLGIWIGLSLLYIRSSVSSIWLWGILIDLTLNFPIGLTVVLFHLFVLLKPYLTSFRRSMLILIVLYIYVIGLYVVTHKIQVNTLHPLQLIAPLSAVSIILYYHHHREKIHSIV